MGAALTEQQRAVVADRGGELLVSAAAGSGKTRVLVERLLERVTGEGIDIDRFLVITFTRAAAAELRGRVAAELNSRLAAAPGDGWLRRQAALVYKAPISTIHALCADLLREFGHKLDLDPDFRLLDEGETGLLRQRVLEDVVEERYEGLKAGDDFSALVDAMAAGRDDSRLLQIASDLHLRIQAHPDPLGWLDGMEARWALPEGVAPEETVWGQVLLRDTAEKARYWAGQMKAGAELCEADSGLEANYRPWMESAARWFGALAEAAECGWEAVRALGEAVLPGIGRKKMDSGLPEVGRVKVLRAGAREALEELGAPFAQSGEEAIGDLRVMTPAVRGLFELVRDFDAALRKEKERRGVLDFGDLEHLTVALLEDRETAETLASRFAEVMVDEYQDTNQVQNAIFAALTGGGRTLFQVGDVKQSIYRFRLADPTIFLDKYARFPPMEREEAGMPRRAVLSKNFRSRPQVLGAVNDLFRAILSPELGELAYTDDQALGQGGDFPGEESPEWRTELDVLLADGEEDEENGKVPRDLQEARFVAGRLRELMLNGFQVTEGGALRPVRPGDMAVLLRSPGPVTHYYARAFREMDLPWQAEGEGDLLAAVEVQVALALLQVVDNPRQDVPLIAALRSPVWRMSADRLAELRSRSPGTDFYTAVEAGAQRGEADCVAFLEELGRLRLEAADRSAHEFLWLLYDRTDLPGLFAAMDGGAARRANLMLLYEYARAFEGAGHKGLYRFLAYLRRLEEGGRGLATPSQARGESAVTLLSVHRAKGLEFPVVVVAGLNRQFNRSDLYASLLFHPELGVGPKRLDEKRSLEYPTIARSAIALKLDREMLSEEMRLLYVAMTRAKDKLILSCALTGGERKLAALAPWAGNPVPAQVLEGRRSVGEWVLLHALTRPEGVALRQVAGGGPVLGGNLESVWDIQVYTLENEGGRWTDAAGEPLGRLPDGVTEGYGWDYPYGGAVETPSKLTATQLKGRDLDQEAAEQAPVLPQKSALRRPRFLREDQGLTGTEKGTAIHLAMQFFDFARSGSLEEVTAELDRLEGLRFLTPEQRAAVPEEKLLAFFRSPVGAEMLAAPRLEREFKFSLLVEAQEYFPGAGAGEKVLLQGVIDCWFEDETGAVTVLDFKTDRFPEPARYAPQVGAYAAALERMTGRKVGRRLLYFFADGSAHAV